MALKLILAAGFGLAMACAGVACAEPITVFGYNLSASIQGATASSYQGSKHYSWFPSGNVAFTRPGDYDDFSAPDDAASAALYSTAHVSAGPAAAIIVDRGNSRELQGMRNIGWAGEAGVYANWWPTRWVRVRVEVLKGLFSEDGLLINTGSDFVTHQGRFTLSAGPRFDWADGGYNNTYFGVTPQEAVASPRFKTAYAPGAGPLAAGIEAAVEYKWIARWRLDLNANYDRLLAQDAASPIVRRTGSPNQYSVAGGVRFMLSD